MQKLSICEELDTILIGLDRSTAITVLSLMEKKKYKDAKQALLSLKYPPHWLEKKNRAMDDIEKIFTSATSVKESDPLSSDDLLLFYQSDFKSRLTYISELQRPDFPQVWLKFEEDSHLSKNKKLIERLENYQSFRINNKVPTPFLNFLRFAYYFLDNEQKNIFSKQFPLSHKIFNFEHAVQATEQLQLTIDRNFDQIKDDCPLLTVLREIWRTLTSEEKKVFTENFKEISIWLTIEDKLDVLKPFNKIQLDIIDQLFEKVITKQNDFDEFISSFTLQFGDNYLILTILREIWKKLTLVEKENFESYFQNAANWLSIEDDMNNLKVFEKEQLLIIDRLFQNTLTKQIDFHDFIKRLDSNIQLFLDSEQITLLKNHFSEVFEPPKKSASFNSQSNMVNAASKLSDPDMDNSPPSKSKKRKELIFTDYDECILNACLLFEKTFNGSITNTAKFQITYTNDDNIQYLKYILVIEPDENLPLSKQEHYGQEIYSTIIDNMKQAGKAHIYKTKQNILLIDSKEKWIEQNPYYTISKECCTVPRYKYPVGSVIVRGKTAATLTEVMKEKKKSADSYQPSKKSKTSEHSPSNSSQVENPVKQQTLGFFHEDRQKIIRSLKAAISEYLKNEPLPMLSLSIDNISGQAIKNCLIELCQCEIKAESAKNMIKLASNTVYILNECKEFFIKHYGPVTGKLEEVSRELSAKGILELSSRQPIEQLANVK